MFFGKSYALLSKLLWVVTIGLFLFLILPIGGLIVLGITDVQWAALPNNSNAILQALRITAITSGITVIIAIIFGTPMGYGLARLGTRKKRIAEVLLVLPIVMPPTVAGVALLAVFGRAGFIGAPLDALFDVRLGFSTVAVIMAQTLVATPLYIYAAKTGFELCDRQLEQVAYTLGASPMRAFFTVVVPQAAPSLVAGVALCWARAAGELGATLVFAGNFAGSTRTLPLSIISALEGGRFGLGPAIAQALILFAATLAVMSVVWFSRRTIIRNRNIGQQ